MLTRDEFIAKAADAILRDQGLDPATCALVRTQAAVAWATAALEAVGAWEMLQSIGKLRWRAQHWLDGEGDSAEMANRILAAAQRHEAASVQE